MAEVPTASSAAVLTAEPVRRVGKRWIALIALANLGLYLGYFAPLGVLLPDQVQAIAGPAGKVAAFGWVVGAGAAVAMIANPVAGALSDRTTGRFGRRHPWTVGGAAAAILGMGFGAYLSVDQALVTQVLPSASGRAKDLGIINIASSGPQVLAPAIAAPLVSRLGGYPTLYLSVAAITILGSAFVWKIRSVP